MSHSLLGLYIEVTRDNSHRSVFYSLDSAENAFLLLL